MGLGDRPATVGRGVGFLASLELFLEKSNLIPARYGLQYIADSYILRSLHTFREKL